MTHTATLNGVLIGDCNDDFILSAPGMTGLGLGGVKGLSEVDRYGHHGTVSGKDYLTARQLSIPLVIFERDDPEAAMQKLRTLKTAWQPTGPDDAVLDIGMAGYGPANDIVRFYGRPREALEVDLTYHYAGIIIVLASFTATDPIGYGPEQSTALAIGNNIVNNPGDASTDRAVITFRGNGGIPSIINESDGYRRIVFRTAVQATHVITIDLRRQTVTSTYQSGIFTVIRDEFASVSPSSTWFSLTPGDNTLAISNITNDVEAEITYRGGWW